MLQAADHYATHAMPVQGALRPYVSALMGAEIAAGPIPLAVAPHESLVLCVQLGRTRDCIEEKGEAGTNTHLTGIRECTEAFVGAGHCVTLFALLTPLGSVCLLDSRELGRAPRERASVAGLLERSLTRSLECEIARAPTLEARMLCFAAWLEARATACRRQSPAALRAGRAAMRVCAEPSLSIDAVADDEQVSRRQIERDFGQWLGTTPRHLAQVARVQAVSRKAQRGAALADIAADVGFADQSHMSRVVKQLTGLTPGQFARSQRTPIAGAFRRATAGGTVYL